MRSILIITSTVFLLIANYANSQKVFEIYAEDFDKFFFRKEVNSRFDILSLLDSLPENCEDGVYHFYNTSDKDSLNKKTVPHTYGTYLNHKKEGEFVSENFQYNKKIKSYDIYWQQVISYHNGRKDGCHKEYYMYYQYNRKKILTNELSTMTVYIEYTDNEYDGFYMKNTDFDLKDIHNKASLTIKYYEKGILIKSMKCDGLGKKNAYHNIGFEK